jgi:hypothetical protein
MFGLTTTRRSRAEVAAAKAETQRIRDERDAALGDAAAYKASAETAARQFTEADEKYVDTCIVNELLTTDLTKARERLAEYGGRRTVAEVLEEHDVHRKALADALGDQKRHLNWEQLIGEVGHLHGSAVEWMGDHAKEKARADELQARLNDAAREPDGEWRGRARRAEKRVAHLEKELDNALGMPPAGLLDSAIWQPGYAAPKPDTGVSAP